MKSVARIFTFISGLSLSLLAGSALAGLEIIDDGSAALPGAYSQAPVLESQVNAGVLPALDQRLPQMPLVVPTTAGRRIGRYSDTMQMLIGRAKDTRLLAVYGYARLVGFDEEFNLKADLLQKVEIEDGRIFTLHLRPGHKWSDGAPFTTEDFRYYWEDVALNEELSPAGPPSFLRVDGEIAKFEVIDETTVRFSWSKPNPFFLPTLAKARPIYIYRPAHYMRQWHAAYGDMAKIEAKMEERGARNWAQLHNKLDDLYRFNNPDLPVLQPWILKTERPAKRFNATRNPYYHRVDESGQQLPYLDNFLMVVSSSALIPPKTGAGETDLQSRGINFADYAFLKQGESQYNYQVRLWETVRGSAMALYPNLNANDAVWQKVLRNRDFRRALSLGVDREEINAVIYSGLGLPANQTILQESPLFTDDIGYAWSDYDPEESNRLLDAIGLKARNEDGIRLLPDGRPMEIVIESAGENTEESDVLELIHDSWLKLGIKLYSKPSQREVLRNRVFTGETIMAIWFGHENGVPNADLAPDEFVPVRQASFQWPKWGQYHETKGRSGEAVDMERPKELMGLFEKWRRATSQEERAAAWGDILQINAEEMYSIGIIAKIPQPVVVRETLRNIPQTGIYNWDPGAQFGVYRPDSFWMVK